MDDGDPLFFHHWTIYSIYLRYHLSLTLWWLKKGKKYWLSPGFEPRRWPLICKYRFKAQFLQGLKPEARIVPLDELSPHVYHDAYIMLYGGF